MVEKGKPYMNCTLVIQKIYILRDFEGGRDFIDPQDPPLPVGVLNRELGTISEWFFTALFSALLLMRHFPRYAKIHYIFCIYAQKGSLFSNKCRYG